MVWGWRNWEAEVRESLFWTRTHLGDHGGSHWEVMCPIPGYDSLIRVDQAMGSVDQHEDTLCSLGLDTPSARAASPGGEGGEWSTGRLDPQSFLPVGAMLRGSSLEWPEGASEAPGGESSFTLSRMVFLMAAGETFSWSAMDCSSLGRQ